MNRWPMQMTLAGAVFVVALLLGLLVPPLLQLAMQSIGRPEPTPAGHPSPTRAPSPPSAQHRFA